MSVTPITGCPDSPLIIAVEGLCYSGKTTLIQHLAPLVSAAAVADYSRLVALPPWPPTDQAAVTAALAHFLTVERHRAQLARAAAAPVVLLDRSPLTLIAHEYGMTALGVPADPAGAIELYATAADAGSILTPHAYVYLTVPDAVTAARRARRGPVAAHLEHPGVRARIDDACHTWLHLLPDRRCLLLDGTAAPAVLARRTAALIAQVGGSPTPSWRALAVEEPRCSA